MSRVRIVLILTENWTMRPAPDVADLVQFAIEAERAGLDAVMVSEHIVLGPSSDAAGRPANPRDYALPGNQDPATPWPSSLVLLSAMGWALGLMVRAALLRFGTNAEVLAWSVAFLIQPVAAVFYPVSSLPGWLQTVAHLVPASYVFEALRAYLDHGTVLVGQLAVAAALDVAYLVVGGWLAAVAFQAVRRRGLLARPGY